LAQVACAHKFRKFDAMLRLAILSILLEWCLCFEHGETNQNFPGFEFGGNRSLDVYRRLQAVSDPLPEECKKSCPGAATGMEGLTEDSLKNMKDLSEQYKKVFGIMCSKQDDFKCILEKCKDFQGGSVTHIKMLGCVCDACPAMVDVLANVLTVSTTNEDDQKQCRMVGPVECISASTECQKVESFSSINASAITEVKSLCTANSYAMCPEGTGKCAKPGEGTATWNADEARSATFLWVLLAVLATSTCVP